MSAVATAAERWLRAHAPPAWVAAVDTGDAEAVRQLSSGPSGVELHRQVAAAGWMTPDWAVEHGGAGASARDAAAVRDLVRRWQIGNVDTAIGTAWVGPTIMDWGDDAQCRRLLPPIAHATEVWCQLFSEPSAGSDLAAVTTRAARDGDVWRISGQKVWTSRAERSQRGLLIARTDADAPKHRGLTAFCLDLRLPGVIVRPLRQMTGDAEFFEVFLDDVVVPDAERLGAEGAGWSVCRTALANERVAGSGVGASPPGSVVGRTLDELLAHRRPVAEPVARQSLVRAWCTARVIELTNERGRQRRAATGSVGPEGSVTKILQAEHTKALQRLFVDLQGPGGVAWEAEDPWATANAWALLRVQAKTIAGGTSEVLRNQVAERVLGLPRDVDPSVGVPWSDVARLYAG